MNKVVEGEGEAVHNDVSPTIRGSKHSRHRKAMFARNVLGMADTLEVKETLDDDAVLLQGEDALLAVHAKDVINRPATQGLEPGSGDSKG
jgi:hypothetical protein